ncbi:MAG TPA: DNA gyrase subunit B, partial [Burkholderiales bacterium]|nr:DNA gyrase subunit B [Burkholderiales bacterium]
KEERYLKDDHERDQFMLRQALVGAALYPRRDADPIRGDALAQLAQSYLLAEAVIDRLGRLIDEGALKAILQGARIDLSDAETTRASMERLSAKLGNGDIKVQARYDEKLERHQLLIERNRHGNLRWSVIDEDFLVSGDYRQITAAAQLVEGLIGPGAYVQRGEHQHAVNEFGQAVQWLRAEVERNATIQRYKGLGEMNPEQLWETTMEPASRRLLKVQIEDAITADEIFIKLMGDEVEPRRDFIEQNALVARLDV